MASHGLPRVAREKNAEKERKLIGDYRALVEQASTKSRDKDYSLESLALTSRLLRKNPEFYTVWNYRRLILAAILAQRCSSSPSPRHDGTAQDASPSQQQLIREDLEFLLPLLKEFPKCYWIWKYRLWLLEQGEAFLPPEQAMGFWTQELGLASHHLSRDERNFHGWNYRRRVISHLERLSGSSYVEAEFAYSTAMIQKALHNFSALHYRSKLIPKLLDERRANNDVRKHMLDSELDLMHNALIDPYNQSAWFYHQFLMSTINSNCPRAAAIVLHLDRDDRLGYYSREIEFIKDMLQDFDDCKWIYQALIQYTFDHCELTEGGVAPFTNELRDWLNGLESLDPLRRGRWRDTREKINMLINQLG